MAKITDSIDFGPLHSANRVVGAPLLTLQGWDLEKGLVLPAAIDLYSERAAGGAGMLTVEAVGVTRGTNPLIAGRGIRTPEQIEGMARIASAIHQEGAKCSLQIAHGGRQTPDIRLMMGDKSAPPPLAPSDKTPPYHGYAPHGLTPDETEAMIEAFVTAAKNAKQAGFDGVTFHGAHGFLLMEFMSPYTNVGRDDIYGRDRMAFASEIIRRARAACGPDFALIWRVSITEGLGPLGINPELVAKEIGPGLEKAGIDAIDLSAGNFEAFYFVGPPLYFPRGVYIDWMAEVQKAVKIPVIGVGRINDARLAEKIIADGRVAAVALGRALLADPQFPNKMFAGRHDEIRQCIACSACTWQQPPGKAAFGCAVNPLLGRPAEQAKSTTRVDKPRRVMVVGGGPAGMQAAEIAAMRGHDVTVFERGEKLGGQVNLASAFPRVYTKELRMSVRWLEKRLKQLEVPVALNTPVTRQLVEAEKPDVVIVATGASPRRPSIPGADLPHVLTTEEYLERQPELGKRVIVIGGSYGSETALSLARQGKEVVLLEEGPEAINATPTFYGPVWRNQLIQTHMHMEPTLRIRNNVKVKAILEDCVFILWGDSGMWSELLPADHVILATAPEPAKALAEELKGLDVEIRAVGDCRSPRSIYWAIQEGAQVALDL